MSNEAPPPVQVLQMMMGMWVAQIAGTAARFGVADAIAGGATDSGELATACDADPESFYRFMRAATTAGFFTETAPRAFALTPLGECLRDGVPGSVRHFLIAELAPGHWLPWGRLYDAVKSGRAMAAETLGMPAWDYYAQDPEERLAFARGMGNLSALVSMDVARLYDPSPYRRIVDVGGSQGVVLRHLLDRAPDARGVLFDLADVVAEASPDPRIEIVAGDFFRDEIPDGDLYVLKSILHDWDDEHCATILRNLHRSAPEGSKLLVVETLLAPAPQPSPVTFMDMNMLVMLGGRERTAEEYGAILGENGFAVDRVIPTSGMFGLIEATRK